MDQFNESKGNSFTPNFWTIFKTENGVTVNIEPHKLIDFCSRYLGYFNYVDYTGQYILVKKARNSIISDASPLDLKHDIKNFLRHEVRNEHVWKEFVKNNWIKPSLTDLIEKLPEAKYNISNKNYAFFFYRNGVVIVSKRDIQIQAYEDFQGIVWKHQIIDRDFVCIGSATEPVFSRFVRNVTQNNRARYTSLMTIIGYLLHPFKDTSLTKAVILLDEKIDFSGAAHGGTGKSLIARAILQISFGVVKDGKRYNSKETFIYDDVRPWHRILYFDDVRMNFDFEEFFSLITGSMKVNRKYKDSITIPPELSPKILITTNYMVKGTGGYTDERRRIEFEIHPYYSKNFTPKQDFGHNLFDEWDEVEWQLFDHFMMSCVIYFIRNGIKMPPQINLQGNRASVLTDPEFVKFMDSTIIVNIAYDKACLINDFKDICPSHKFLSKIKFKDWIDIWAECRNYKAVHYKSNGKAWVRFENMSN